MTNQLDLFDCNNLLGPPYHFTCSRTRSEARRNIAYGSCCSACHNMLRDNYQVPEVGYLVDDSFVCCCYLSVVMGLDLEDYLSMNKLTGKRPKLL